MNVGYFSINQASRNGKINWDKISEQKVIEQGKFLPSYPLRKTAHDKNGWEKRIGCYNGESVKPIKHDNN